MSHFTVLVITPNCPEQKALSELLAPWHEFECTGLDNQYVVDVDQTEEARSTFQEESVPRLRDPEGQLHEPYEDRFYRDLTADEQAKIGTLAGSGWSGPAGISFHSKDWGDGRGYRTKTPFIPDGWAKTEVPAREVSTFAEWAVDHYGYEQVPPGGRATYGFIEVTEGGDVVRVVNRTNPNKKWDWWQIGGRWSGHLKARSGCPAAAMVSRDQLQLSAVDIEGMHARARSEAALRWDGAQAAAGDLPRPIEFSLCVERTKGADSEADYDAARKDYWAQPAIVALQEAFKGRHNIDREIEALQSGREEYLTRAANGALPTFAVVKDGQWFERGRMGWWAAVSDEKAGDEWNAEFQRLLADLPPETWLTLVDCHI